MTIASVRTIQIGHSPDPDDAFLFYAMAHGKVGHPDFRFEHTLMDIETLNQWALEGKLEITAMSLHAYAYASDRYAILPYGSSVGVKYGPVLISREPMSLEELRGQTIAVPGAKTTAMALLRLALPEFKAVIVPFDQIMAAVKAGGVKAGLLIHEGQLTYRREGFFPVVDFGVWWQAQAGLPLPLGLNCVRKDLGTETMRTFSRLLRESIEYGQAHREEAIAYAMQYGRGLARDLTDRFVNMYVNDYAMDLKDDGRAGIATLLSRWHQAGIIPHTITPEFVS